MRRLRIRDYVGLIFIAIFLGTAVLVVDGLCDRLGKADAALVLGSKVELDGQLSLRLRARLDKALELYRAGYFPLIIVSGGTGREGFDESAVMKDYLVSQGVPGERVVMDGAGNTTFLSAKNTRSIAQRSRIHSVLVVSQYFHLPRARLALERFGLFPVYTAHAEFFEIRDVYSSPRELFGYLSYLFRRYPKEP